MSAPTRPQFNPADAWEALVKKGLSQGEATRHVLLQVQNQPEAIRAQFLKDVDPGKLVAFGLGAADMMSFGMGNQVARATEMDGLATPYGPSSPALLTQQTAQSQHPAAHIAGEIAGLVGPAGVEFGLTKAGRLTASAVRTAVNAIRNRTLRAAAKTTLNATQGAAYAGAQAAGHTEGGLAPRVTAAAHAAPYGAAAGAILPAVLAGLKRAPAAAGRIPGARYLREVLSDLAGAQPPTAPATKPLPGLLGVGDDIGVVPMQGRHMPAQIPIDPLEMPTFMRSQATKASLAKQSVAELQSMFNNPQTPDAMRYVIAQELVRRQSARAGSLLPE